MTRVIIMAIITAVISYLLGSLNFSIIFTKIFTKKDIRTLGSGNAGLTNVIRSTGPVPAILALIGDFGKAVVAAIIANVLFNVSEHSGLSPLLALWTGMFCIIGHMYPIFYKFKGGKGVLTAAAMVLMISPSKPIIFFVCIAVFAFFTIVTKIVSLSSIIAVSCFPVAMWCFYNIAIPQMDLETFEFFSMFFIEPRYFMTVFSTFLPFLIIVKHFQNTERMLRSVEKNFSFSKKKQAEAAPLVPLSDEAYKANVLTAIRLISLYIFASCFIQQLNPLKLHPNLSISLFNTPNQLYSLKTVFDLLAGGEFVSNWMYYTCVVATFVVLSAIGVLFVGIILTCINGVMTDKGVKLCRIASVYITAVCAIIVLGVLVFNFSLNELTKLPFRLRIPLSSLLTMFSAIMINKLISTITPKDNKKEEKIKEEA